MKAHLILLALVLAGSSLVVAQNTPPATSASTPAPPPENPNAPDISFEKEVHDFGNVKYAGDGTYEFKFTNTGKEPLTITKATGSCGCTVPTWSKEPVEKGKNGVIKVSYDTKRVGPFTKTVTITSNAKTPQKIITIKGTVLPDESKQEQTPVRKIGNGAIPMASPK